MIKQFVFKNWKSFGDAALNIEQMSFLIGTNAGGKSNALDALDFMHRLACGATVSECAKDTRGGIEWLVMKDKIEASIEVVVMEGETEYSYGLSLNKSEKGITISEEWMYTGDYYLFWTDCTRPNGALDIRCRTGNRGQAKKYERYSNTSILYQFGNMEIPECVKIGVDAVLNNMKSIFMLNPLPNLMRQYVPLSAELSNDGSNVAGLLAGMDDERKHYVEENILRYMHALPERDVNRIWAEKVGRFSSDAMLYCEEKWTNNQSQILDARGMSDGTLRFIAIVVALLTCAEGSLLVVEEIDNGLHPSRTSELLNMLHELGEKRHIDILCTTHNPELIDRLGNEMIPFISVIKRSPVDGSSCIYALDSRENLLELLSNGTVGQAMISDSI